MDTVDGEKLECVFTKGVGWHAKYDEDKKCIKRVSYYQCIPYVLLLQVSSIIISIILKYMTLEFFVNNKKLNIFDFMA